MKIRDSSTTLEDKIVVEISEAVSAIDGLVSSLKDLKTALKSIGDSNDIENTTKQANTATTAFTKLANVMSSINNSSIVKTTKSLLGLGSAVMIIRKLINSITEMTQASVDYIETLNLFSVSLGQGEEELNKYYEQAIAFQDELAEKLGVTKAESMEYQATFNSMAKSMGVNADAAYTLSENLTKLTYDLSSLYNIDAEEAYSKLSSGVISGQSKSLRTLGIDVTEDTVQQVLDKLDIDVDYSSLSQAEKVVARYIAVLEQATIAEGDLANTMSTPANQLRIFNAQVTQFKVNMGNLWQGFLGGILPYINGVMMVVNELLEMAAELFGFEYTGVSGATTSVDDLTDSVDDALDSVKELKNQLMGFDEINNITTNDSSSSGTVSSTGTGINQALLDALEGYDNLMDSVESKAEKVKEALEDWLGITDGSYEGLNKVLEVVKTIGVALATWTISSAITGFLEKLGVLTSTEAFEIAFGLTLAVIGFYVGYNGVQKLLDGDITIENVLQAIGANFLAGLGVSMGLGTLISKLSKGAYTLSLGSKLAMAFGIGMAITGFEIGYGGMQKLLDGDITLTNVLEAIGGNFFTGLGASITLGKLIKELSKSGYTLSLGKTLGLAFGIGFIITGIETTIEGIKEGDAYEKIAGAIETAIGVGATVLTTGAGWKISIVASLAVLLTSLSIEFNDEIQDTIQDGYADVLSMLGELSDMSPVTSAIFGGFDKVAIMFETIAETGISELDNPIAVMANAVKVLGERSEETTGELEELDEATNEVSSATDLSSEYLSEYISALDESSDEYQEYIDIIEEATEAYNSNIKSIQSTYDSTMDEITGIKGLTTELGTLVDENGKVIDGNEELVDVILSELSDALGEEYTRVGDVIYKNEEVIDSYSDLVDSIDEYLEEMEKEAIIEYYSDLYTEAVKQRQSAYDELIKAQQEYNEAVASGDESALEAAQLNLAARDKVYQDSCSDLEYYKGQVSDIYTNGADTIIETVSIAGQEINSEIAQYAEDATETYRDMAQNNIDKWEEMYDTLEADTKASMLAQSSTLDTWSPTLESKWKEMAESDVDAYNEALSVLDEDTRLLIETLTTNVEDLSDEQIEQWKQLATDDEEAYNKALSSLPTSTQTLISTLTSTTGKLSATQIQAWADLAKNDKTAYENNLKGLDTTTSNRIQSCVDAINNKQYTAEQAAEKLADAVEEGVDTIDTTDTGKNVVLGVAEGIDKNKNNHSLWQSISDLCSNVKTWFNSLFDSHSPSRVMKKLAYNIPLGIAEGIEDGIPETVDSVKEMAESVTSAVSDNMDTDMFQDLTEGISINSSDYRIDTNQFVDYGEIAGSINAQSQVSVDGNMSNMIAQACYKAFCEAMKSEGINVEIEARTDEGVIFNKVQKSAKQYVMQTGENPFPVLV